MSSELICSWLKVPAKPWPPDPYTLLGLDQGEADLVRIEKHVHDRMEMVRRYQLAHPDEATEVMNRLAQAFVQLQSEQIQKQAGQIARASKSAMGLAPRPALAEASGEPVVEDAADTTPPVATEQESPPPPVDPVYEAARSAEARRGLTTKRALYQRISATRRLIRAWTQAGLYLGNTSFKLKHKDQAFDLARQLTILRQELQQYPALIGHAGQPGYYVIVLARQPRIVQTFQALLPHERERLVNDWEAGLMFLAAHRLFLREEMWALRQRNKLQRLGLTIRVYLWQRPLVWLSFLALLALNLAYAPLRTHWDRQLLAIGGLVAVLVLWQLYQSYSRKASLQRTRRPRERSLEKV